MTVIVNKERWTTKDLEELPDVPGERYEIIDGELIVTHAPHWNHQRICDRIIALFSRWDFDSAYGEARSGPGIIFSDDNNVIPDLVWISNERLNSTLDENGKIHLAPELAVEVLSYGSDSENRDRENKLGLYSRRGVSEYWIINWQNREIEVYQRINDTSPLQLLQTLRGHDALTSPLFPGFNFPVSTVFQPIR